MFPAYHKPSISAFVFHEKPSQKIKSLRMTLNLQKNFKKAKTFSWPFLTLCRPPHCLLDSGPCPVCWNSTESSAWWKFGLPQWWKPEICGNRKSIWESYFFFVILNTSFKTRVSCFHIIQIQNAFMILSPQRTAVLSENLWYSCHRHTDIS